MSEIKSKTGIFQNRIFWLVVAIVIIGGLAWGGVQYRKKRNIAKDRYSVFLTNGQVYFGNLSEVGDTSLVLTNIYYLKSETNLQSGEAIDQKKISLVRLGSELHGPESKMTISKNQVLFYEKMRSDSKINKAIDGS